MYGKIAVICAGDSEVAPFLAALEAPVATEKAMLRLHEGTLAGARAVVLFCGVCKVNAALATQILIDTCRVDAVINAGTAGGMAPQVELFDTVVTTEAAYHDVDEDILTEFHPWLPTVYFQSDPQLLALARRALAGFGGRVHFGRTVTGEKFIEDAYRADINARHAPLAVDMETAAVAHVCHVNRTPFIAIRSITDTASHAGLRQFEQNCAQAAEVSKAAVVALIEQMGATI